MLEELDFRVNAVYMAMYTYEENSMNQGTDIRLVRLLEERLDDVKQGRFSVKTVDQIWKDVERDRAERDHRMKEP